MRQLIIQVKMLHMLMAIDSVDNLTLKVDQKVIDSKIDCLDGTWSITTAKLHVVQLLYDCWNKFYNGTAVASWCII